MVFVCADCVRNRVSRDLIYAGLLRSMSPEHKFNSAAKLCGEVLAGVADGLLPLSECEEVLRDALCLMACKEIKVGQCCHCHQAFSVRNGPGLPQCAASGPPNKQSPPAVVLRHPMQCRGDTSCSVAKYSD
jgi:hypothetical protein